MQWAIDPTHSQIQFAVKHLGISTVRGTFDKFSGTITADNGVVSAVSVDVDTSSVNTNQAQRDEHLRSGEFFDTAAHPHAVFNLTSIAHTGADVVAHGDLTIRGVTKPITLTGETAGPAKDPWGNQKVSATLEVGTSVTRNARNSAPDSSRLRGILIECSCW